MTVLSVQTVCGGNRGSLAVIAPTSCSLATPFSIVTIADRILTQLFGILKWMTTWLEYTYIKHFINCNVQMLSVHVGLVVT